MVLLKHYWMSLDVVALPFILFESSREFVGAIADAMEGKTYSASFTHMTNFSLTQPINMLISLLVFSILTSPRVIS